jgi:phage shock protein A
MAEQGGFFSRLARLIRANLNDLISKSEDPEKMLNQLVLDMGNQLAEAKKQVAVAIADEKRLGKQIEAEAAKASEWERRAMLAVRSGDDALAKEALARLKEHAGLTEQYREQWQKHKAGVDQLKQALRVLNNKIEEAKRKKGLLIARKKRAEAQKAIQETLGGLKSASAFEAFDEMAGRIERMEAEAEAGAEIAEEYSGDLLAQKFEKLDATAGADEDLLALKRKMGLAPPEPAPQPVRVDATAGGAGGGGQRTEADELAEALAELDAEERRELTMKR